MEMSYYPLPSELFRDNLHWLGDFARLLKVQFTRNEGMRNDAPIYAWVWKLDRPVHRALRAVLFTKSVWVL